MGQPKPGFIYNARALPETFSRGRSSKQQTPYFAFTARTEASPDDGYAGGEEINVLLYVTEATAEMTKKRLGLAGWREGEALPGSLGSCLFKLEVKDEGKFGLKGEIVDPNRMPKPIDTAEVQDFDAQMFALMGMGAPPAAPAGSVAGDGIPF